MANDGQLRPPRLGRWHDEIEDRPDHTRLQLIVQVEPDPDLQVFCSSQLELTPSEGRSYLDNLQGERYPHIMMMRDIQALIGTSMRACSFLSLSPPFTGLAESLFASHSSILWSICFSLSIASSLLVLVRQEPAGLCASSACAKVMFEIDRRTGEGDVCTRHARECTNCDRADAGPKGPRPSL